MEPVARAPGLGGCIHNVVHGLEYELEGSAILLRRSVCMGWPVQHAHASHTVGTLGGVNA